MVLKKKSDRNSSDPAEVQKFRELTKKLPDVRQDKVYEIKKKIESGEYQVDAEAVAKKMLELSQDVKKMTSRSKTNK
jgi:negative regulator of flagellin synthesis FlgM